MLCYLDMTFCRSDCANTACRRHFGPDDEAAAKEWARRCGFDRGEAPIAWSDFSSDCENYAPPVTKVELPHEGWPEK